MSSTFSWFHKGSIPFSLKSGHFSFDIAHFSKHAIRFSNQKLLEVTWTHWKWERIYTDWLDSILKRNIRETFRLYVLVAKPRVQVRFLIQKFKEFDHVLNASREVLGLSLHGFKKLLLDVHKRSAFSCSYIFVFDWVRRYFIRTLYFYVWPRSTSWINK